MVTFPSLNPADWMCPPSFAARPGTLVPLSTATVTLEGSIAGGKFLCFFFLCPFPAFLPVDALWLDELVPPPDSVSAITPTAAPTPSTINPATISAR